MARSFLRWWPLGAGNGGKGRRGRRAWQTGPTVISRDGGADRRFERRCDYRDALRLQPDPDGCRIPRLENPGKLERAIRYSRSESLCRGCQLLLFAPGAATRGWRGTARPSSAPGSIRGNYCYGNVRGALAADIAATSLTLLRKVKKYY